MKIATSMIYSGKFAGILVLFAGILMLFAGILMLFAVTA